MNVPARRFDLESQLQRISLFCSLVGLLVMHLTVLKGLLLLLKLEVRSWGANIWGTVVRFLQPRELFVTSYTWTANSKGTTILYQFRRIVCICTWTKFSYFNFFSLVAWKIKWRFFISTSLFWLEKLLLLNWILTEILIVVNFPSKALTLRQIKQRSSKLSSRLCLKITTLKEDQSWTCRNLFWWSLE